MLKLFIYGFQEFDEKDCFDALCKTHDFTYGYISSPPSMDNAHLAKGYDGISINTVMLDVELLEKFQSMGVHYILTPMRGYSYVDIEKAEELGLRVLQINYPAEAVAEYSVILIKSLIEIRLIFEMTKRKNISIFENSETDLEGYTIGVIGTGQIGSAVIKHLSALGCRVLAYDPYINMEVTSLCNYVSLEQLYKECDAITLHTPRAVDGHYLNQVAFEVMKPGVMIVNTACGSLIDAGALIEALEKGQVGGAALAVIEDEKGIYYLDRLDDCIANRNLEKLHSFPNVILTPYITYHTESVVKNMAESTIKCLFEIAHNRENSINKLLIQ